MSKRIDDRRPSARWFALCGVAFLLAAALDLWGDYQKTVSRTSGQVLRDPFFILDVSFIVACVSCFYLYAARGAQVAKWLMIGWCMSKATDILQMSVNVWLVTKAACAIVAALILVGPHLFAWLKKDK